MAPERLSGDLLQDWHRYSSDPRGWKAVLARLIFDAGFTTVFLFRLASRLQRGGKLVRARLIHRFNMALCACELSPNATVGPGLFLPHPFGVTIGTGCEVGPEVTLYQGVVVGATSAGGQDDGAVRYPRLGREVVIYPHALVYGGIEVGDGTVVLGNSVVNRDLVAGGTYAGAPASRVLPRGAPKDAVEADAPLADGGDRPS